MAFGQNNLIEILIKSISAELIKYTEQSSCPIKLIYDYIPKVMEIRQILEDQTNGIDTIICITSGERKVKPRREGEFEEILRYGEYIYYYYQDVKQMLDVNTYSNNKMYSDLILDHIQNCFANYYRVSYPGIIPDPEPDYLQYTLTYEYFKESLHNSFNVIFKNGYSDSNFGEFYENEIDLECNIKNMLAVKYPTVDTIVYSGSFNNEILSGTYPIFNTEIQSGSGTQIISGTNNPNTNPIYIGFDSVTIQESLIQEQLINFSGTNYILTASGEYIPQYNLPAQFGYFNRPHN